MDGRERFHIRKLPPIEPSRPGVRTLERAVDGREQRPTHFHRESLAVRHVVQVTPLAAGLVRAGRSIAVLSLCQGTEGFAVLGHELTPFAQLPFHFRVVRRKQISLGRLHREDVVVLLNLHADEHFLGQQDAGGSANSAKFELHINEYYNPREKFRQRT